MSKVIRISLADISKLNFTEYFSPVFNNYYNKYFDMPPGKEHYRLLSYLSTQFTGENILDIGTSDGHSALALSYNKLNKVHSFDIVNLINSEKVQSLSNVNYYLENLWDAAIRTKCTEFIKSCPLIFLDVDPHEGDMEIDFYRFLKSINYQGMMVCDDVHHFEGMRNKFWSKIPSEEKYDLTKYGHWSGTGLICFNTEIKIELL
jgi:predicted O-methyltransferase YrrM